SWAIAELVARHGPRGVERRDDAPVRTREVGEGHLFARFAAAALAVADQGDAGLAGDRRDLSGRVERDRRVGVYADDGRVLRQQGLEDIEALGADVAVAAVEVLAAGGVVEVGHDRQAQTDAAEKVEPIDPVRVLA